MLHQYYPSNASLPVSPMDQPTNPEHYRSKLPHYDFSVISAQQRLRLVIEELFTHHRIASKSDFAEKLNVPPYVLSRLLSGDNPITQVIADSIEETFGIPEMWLLYGTPITHERQKD